VPYPCGTWFSRSQLICRCKLTWRLLQPTGRPLARWRLRLQLGESGDASEICVVMGSYHQRPTGALEGRYPGRPPPMPPANSAADSHCDSVKAKLDSVPPRDRSTPHSMLIDMTHRHSGRATHVSLPVQLPIHSREPCPLDSRECRLALALA
jgi:hypothetical protein